MDKKIIHTKAYVEKKSDTEDGVLEVAIGSSAIVDRTNEIISQDGWELANFKKNPVFLWAHNFREDKPPIGKVVKLWFEGEKAKKKLMFAAKFDLADDFARMIYQKYVNGFLNAFSVGFMPLDWDPEIRTYTKSELFEISAVPVPANPEALVQLRQLKGIEPHDWSELYPAKQEESQVENGGEPDENVEEPESSEVEVTEEPEQSVETQDDVAEDVSNDEVVGEEVVDETVEENSDTEEAEDVINDDGNEEAVAEDSTDSDDTDEAEVVNKRAVPYSATPTTEEGAEWNASAAKRRVRDWTGGPDKDNVNWSKYRRAFAWYDSENVEDYGSYKLPHHDVSGGELKTVWRGVAAAMAALLGARGGVDIPDGDRKAVYNHLKKHYAQYDKPVPDFRAVEDQVLKDYQQEIEAMTHVDEYIEVTLDMAKMQSLLRKELRAMAKKNKKKDDINQPELEDILKILNRATNRALKTINNLKGGESKK